MKIYIMESKWLNHAISGNNEGILELLKQGMDINFQGDLQGKSGWTALMFASAFSNTKSSLNTVKLLLEKGANVNIGRNNGLTPLLLAVKYSNTTSSLDTVKLLLENGGDINMKSLREFTPLMTAVRYSNSTSSINTVKWLIENGASVNEKNCNGFTALMIASRYSNSDSSMDTIKLLVENGADITIKDNLYFTALSFAMRYANTTSSIDTVRYLLERGANINIKTFYHETLLNFAVKISADMVNLVIQYGANLFDKIDYQNDEYQKIIDIARWKRLYQRDRETAKRFTRNSQLWLPVEIWEIILLEKRRQQLCQNLKSDKHKNILYLFAQELKIPVTSTMSKAQLSGYIAHGLVYCKEEKYRNKSKNELAANLPSMLLLARKFGIDMNRSTSEILTDLVHLY